MKRINIQLRVDDFQYPDLFAFLNSTEDKFHRGRIMKEICQRYFEGKDVSGKSAIEHKISLGGHSVSGETPRPYVGTQDRTNSQTQPDERMAQLVPSDDPLHVPLELAHITGESFTMFG